MRSWNNFRVTFGRRFAAPWKIRKDGAADPQAAARENFPALLDALSDTVWR